MFYCLEFVLTQMFTNIGSYSKQKFSSSKLFFNSIFMEVDEKKQETVKFESVTVF